MEIVIPFSLGFGAVLYAVDPFSQMPGISYPVFWIVLGTINLVLGVWNIYGLITKKGNSNKIFRTAMLVFLLGAGSIAALELIVSIINHGGTINSICLAIIAIFGLGIGISAITKLMEVTERVQK